MQPLSSRNLSQLAAFNKARKIAAVIVEQKSTLLRTLYTNIKKPKTFELIADRVRPKDEEKPGKSKFLKSVIGMAIKQVIGEEKMAEINKLRDAYYAKKLRETIKANNGEKVVDKIHYMGGKAVWGKYGKDLASKAKAKAAEQ